MLSKINSLEDLLAEKARLRAQIDIVQGELNASTKRTREELRVYLDEKFSLSKQIGQMFQGGGAVQTVGSSAVGALGRAAGMGSWWTGVLSALAPTIINFVRRQIQLRRERKLAAAETAPAEAKPKAPKRKLFKRKTKKPDSDQPEA